MIGQVEIAGQQHACTFPLACKHTRIGAMLGSYRSRLSGRLALQLDILHDCTSH